MTAVVAGCSGAGEQQIPYGNDRKKSKGKCPTQANTKTGLEWATREERQNLCRTEGPGGIQPASTKP
jgi:hypothetical protein